MARPASLSLVMPKSTSTVSSTISSPKNLGSSSSSPREARPITTRHVDIPIEDQQRSPEFTSLPPFPSSPSDSSMSPREFSKGFFSNLKASKSSNKVHHVEPTIRQVSEDTLQSNSDKNKNTVYPSRRRTGSTNDLNLVTSMGDVTLEEDRDQQPQAHNGQRRPEAATTPSESSIVISPDGASRVRKPKPRLGGLLTRTRSMRMDEGGRKSKSSTPVRAAGPEIRMQSDEGSEDEYHQGPPQSAPLRQDKSYQDMLGSSNRNRSADRHTPSNHSQESVPIRRNEKVSTQGLSASSASSSRESGSSHLLTNLINTSNKAAGGLGKAGKTIFGKVSRSGSSNAKEEERYTLRVINLPLVRQTRQTRIAPRLADSRDKTEFWMPALPWRCIDFLNFKGCEEEGLYRIPGSELQIRHWQKRFDQEGDINLFDEPELYDINIVGSMFKSWLRDLPTEILPKYVQAKVAHECMGATACPQLLKDELSSLPPWNYYLLFAITCHLSLLIAYSEKNKMNFPNLCVCFQPALRIDNFCFQFLVQDWRNCWQGCWTEREALEEEYRILEGRLPSSGSGGSGDDSSPGSTAVAEEQSVTSSTAHHAVADERSLASSGSHRTVADERSLASSNDQKPSGAGRGQSGRPPPLIFTQPSDEHLSTIYSETTSTPTTTNRFDDDKENYPDRASNHTPLPELAPVQPLSPIVHQFH